MKVYDALPPASARVGFYRAVGPWKDVAVVEFGPEGTMHYVQSAVRGETGHFFATGLKERQIIFGDVGGLEKAILEIDQRLKPNLLVIMSSPVSEIIGADLRAVCVKMKRQVRSDLIVWENIPVESRETLGKRIAYQKAAAWLKKLPYSVAAAKKSGALVLGLSEVDYNGVSDLNEIRRMLWEYFGVPLLNDELGRYDLAAVNQAQWILVVEPEAVPLAAAAQELWGTPWHQGVPYGLSSCTEMVNAAAQAFHIQPSARWQQEQTEAELAIHRFRTSTEARRKRRFFLDVRPSRIDALEALLSKELGLQTCIPSSGVSALSTDGAVTKSLEISREDVLLASGLLCALHAENSSLCMDDPVVRHKTFSCHLPLMGIWGTENLLSILYSFLL